MKLKMILVLACVVLTMGLTARADNSRFAIDGRAGTLGLGGDLVVNLFRDVNFRAGIGVFSFDYDSTINGLDYQFNLDLRTFPLTIDWYPFHGAFHVSGGVIVNDTDLDYRAKSSTTVEVGDQTYTAAEAGTLLGSVDFKRVAPYAGIGWGNPFGQDNRWGLMLDLGVAFTGSPDVTLRATGSLASDPTFQSELRKEQQDIQDKVDDYKFYPVVSLSLYYRF
jgi:hypothetical protein